MVGCDNKTDKKKELLRSFEENGQFSFGLCHFMDQQSFNFPMVIILNFEINFGQQNTLKNKNDQYIDSLKVYNASIKLEFENEFSR